MLIKRIRLIIYRLLVNFYPWIYRNIYGMTIGEGTAISGHARLDLTINPKGIHIGSHTRLTRGVIMLAHDDCRGIKTNTYIGDNCFLGNNVIIMPGVKIGNQVIVGAGSVVTKDIPDNCIAAGNPARIIRMDIRCEHYGKIK